MSKDETGLEDFSAEEMQLDKILTDQDINSMTSFSEAKMREKYDVMYVGGYIYLRDKETFNLIKTTREIAKAKFGSNTVKSANFYQGFSNTADNLNYKSTCGDFVNTNVPILYDPVKGKWPMIESALRHTFGDKFDLIIELICCKIRDPRKSLPMIILASKENNTGKTSIGNFMCKIMGGNAKKVRPVDICNSRFNSMWVDKQLVFTDETAEGPDKYKALNTLKELVTGDEATSEGKGSNISSVHNNLWIWFATNDELGSAVMEYNDSRIFPVKVPVMKVGQEISKEEFDKRTESEIPAFLHYLINEYKLPKSRSRLRAKPSEYMTDLKKSMIDFSKSDLISWLENIIPDLFEVADRHKKNEVDFVSFNAFDLEPLRKIKDGYLKSELFKDGRAEMCGRNAPEWKGADRPTYTCYIKMIKGTSTIPYTRGAVHYRFKRKDWL